MQSEEPLLLELAPHQVICQPTKKLIEPINCRTPNHKALQLVSYFAHIEVVSQCAFLAN